MNIHIGKEYKCKDCDYKTQWKQQLKEDVKIHAGDEYKCKECDYKTVKKHGCKVHMMNISFCVIVMFAIVLCNDKALRMFNGLIAKNNMNKIPQTWFGQQMIGIKLVHRFEIKNCICKGKSTGRPSVLTENVIENIQERINRSPKKAVSQLSQQTGLSVGTCFKAFKKNLHMHPLK
ncbi:hypothetical protein FQA39_LY11973 [Lamprigera yunnana]|nr:hypothetical protein FQA39_LY11973 [Lamprigera yunnana]